mgnify:CR=1 FL=1
MNYNAHPFSLRQLQYVVAAADNLSFRKAAESCHVSQPSLSAGAESRLRSFAVNVPFCE